MVCLGKGAQTLGFGFSYVPKIAAEDHRSINTIPTAGGRFINFTNLLQAPLKQRKKNEEIENIGKLLREKMDKE